MRFHIGQKVQRVGQKRYGFIVGHRRRSGWPVVDWGCVEQACPDYALMPAETPLRDRLLSGLRAIDETAAQATQRMRPSKLAERIKEDLSEHIHSMTATVRELTC